MKEHCNKWQYSDINKIIYKIKKQHERLRSLLLTSYSVDILSTKIASLDEIQTLFEKAGISIDNSTDESVNVVVHIKF